LIRSEANNLLDFVSLLALIHKIIPGKFTFYTQLISGVELIFVFRVFHLFVPSNKC